MKAPFDHNNMDADSSDTETLPPEDEIWPPPSPGKESENESGNDDEMQYFEDTQVVDDVTAFGEAFETQVVGPDDEIPVMDWEDETQVLNLAGETQVVDEFHYVENDFTQVLDEHNVQVCVDSDAEGSDQTQALCDTQEVFDGDNDDDSINQPKLMDLDSCKEEDTISKNKSESSCDKKNHSGSVHTGFPSVRIASLRAGGLRARETALKRASQTTSSSPNKSDSSSEKMHVNTHTEVNDIRTSPNHGKEINQDLGQEKDDEQTKEFSSGSRFSVCKSTVRKLFADDIVSETKQLEFGFENDLAGLSYINSQEPGESSQANALDFVDNFLKFNIIENDQDVDLKKSTGGKSKALSSDKRSKNLAKIPLLESADRDNGIFDWDDNREDECGGEFFLKKKDLFFHDGVKKRKSFTQPRKPKCLDYKGKKSVEKCGDEKEDEKLKNVVQSDSRVILRKKRGNSSKSSNFVKKLDTEFNEVSNEQDMLDVGPDTQMAAEAMEILCVNLVIPKEKDCRNIKKGEARNNKVDTKKRVSPKKASTGTRQSKRLKSHAEGTKEVSDTEPVKAQPKRGRPRASARLDAKKSCVENVTEDLDNVCSKASDFHETDKSHDKSHSNRQKQLASFTPVSHRTRRLKEIYKKSTDSEEEMNDLDVGPTRRKKRRIDTIELKEAKSVSNKVSDPKPTGIPSPLKIGVADYPKRRRSSRKFPLNTQEAKARHNTRSAQAINAVTSVKVDSLPKASVSASTTPLSCKKAVNAVSPICMGDEYHKQSCRKLSLTEELSNLVMSGLKPIAPDSRKRRDMSDVKVLFSHHLDSEIIKQQKKILTRLRASEVSSMSEATHFITDQFVRTRNMLEAIALGKPVVTHLWLDSCGQASCLMDEKNFLLRDLKKEKEFGFSMPVSLARAIQHPLLKGQRVLITPNTKPGKEILASLVKAVSGLAVERLGRSAMKDEKLQDELLILSCEEDYKLCVPYLERGAAVYSSELLLNGIVTQKLEYPRHRLFLEHVKSTRSTIWVKKDNNQYLPVTRCK